MTLSRLLNTINKNQKIMENAFEVLRGNKPKTN